MFDTQLPETAQGVLDPGYDLTDNREVISVFMVMPNLKVQEMEMYSDSFNHPSHGLVFEFVDGMFMSADLEENGFYYSAEDCIDDSIDKLMAQSSKLKK